MSQEIEFVKTVESESGKWLLIDRDYDLASPAIQCNADKDGAKVWLVEADCRCYWRIEHGNAPCRVLDFSQADAEQTFWEDNQPHNDDED